MELRCQVVDHDDAVIDCICIEKGCQNNRLMCSQCVRETHKTCNYYTRKEFICQLMQAKKMQFNQPKEIIQLQELIQKLLKTLKELDQNITQSFQGSNNNSNQFQSRLDQILNSQKQLTSNDWREGYELLQFSQSQFNLDFITPQIEEINAQISQINQIKPKVLSYRSDWNTITQNKPCTIQTSHIINTIDISPDGKYIASAGNSDCSIQIWDPNTGRQIGDTLRGHNGAIYAIKYSQTGDCIVSCSYDQTIRQWDTKTFKQIGQTIIGHRDRVDRVAYSLDQNFILSGSIDKTIRVWDRTSGKEILDKQILHKQPIYCMILSPTVSEVAFADGENKIFIWDYDRHISLGQPLSGHRKQILSISYSSDGKLIVSSDCESTIKLWDVATRKQIVNIVGHQGDYIYTVNFSPDMRFIISGGSDNTARIWNRQTGQEIVLGLLHHKDKVHSGLFSLDNRYIITGSNDKQITVREHRYN